MKPLLGIENCKFQPIIRKLQNINIELSPPEIFSSAPVVKKLLKKIEPNINLQDINAQQSTANKTPQNGGVVHKDKIKKIMKFEKVMKKFCKGIGIDKRTLLSIIGGG